MTDLYLNQSMRNNEAGRGVNGRYQLGVSQAVQDPAWDAFLAQMPDGHHVQTSLWAQIKAALGWGAVRLVLTEGEQIVAGAQLLTRPLPLIGQVGYIAKGPVFVNDDPGLARLLIPALQRLVKRERIQHLTVQLPGDGQNLVQLLVENGFQPGTTEVAPPATLLLDLSKDIDTLLGEMNAKTRYNIRLSERKGITVREGSAKDLDAYYRILTATSQRQQFSPYPKRYFTEMWRLLSPAGCVKLFLAEYAGEVVSAQLAVPFGQTMINKMSVWNGRYGNRRPNEAIQWAAIQWAKAEGYRYYDFEGIKPAAAQAILNGEPVPETIKQTVTSYKLGFGGQPRLFSGAFEYVYNPLYRLAYTEIFPRIRTQRKVKRLLKRLRTAGSN